MRKPLLVLVVVLLALPVLADTVTCAPATLTDYIANGSCAEDPFVIKNFAWNSYSGDSFVNVTPDQVWITPSTSPGAFGLTFRGTPGQPNPFDISGTNEIFATLDYTIDPRPPILTGTSLQLSATSPSGGGFAKLTALVCAGGLLKESCAGGTDLSPVVVQDFGEGDPRNILFATVKFPTGVNLVDIRLILDMEANGGVSEITGGGASATATAVPEPASIGLAIAGLSLLAGFARFRRS